MTEIEQHYDAINQFIALANKMKDDGMPVKVVSSALMTANAFYASYTVAGNNGALTESGIDKMAKLFAEKLAQVGDSKRAAAEKSSGAANS